MSKYKKQIAIVVLAAGKEDLKSVPKPLLPWGNSTLLGHTIKEMVKTQINDLYVVLGHEFDAVFERHKHFPVHFIKNPNYLDGEISGLTECLKWISKTKVDGVLFLYGDQPHVDHLYLKELIYTYNCGVKSIVATEINHKFGLPILFDKLYFEALQSANVNLNELNRLISQQPKNVTALLPKTPLLQIEDEKDYNTLHNDWFGEVNPLD
ncbi:MAG: nucleotidyltransferase family protein [Salibacteraceae bacterium]